MPALTVTPIYTAFFALMLIYLAIQVIKCRRKNKVLLLDGGFSDLQRAIRSHGNFTEYVPIILLLIAFSELNGANTYVLHAMGAILIAGRLLHMRAIMTESLKMRVRGMTLTFFSLISGSIVLIATLFLR